MKIKTWKRRLARSCITFGLCLSGCTHWLQCERDREIYIATAAEYARNWLQVAEGKRSQQKSSPSPASTLNGFLKAGRKHRCIDFVKSKSFFPQIAPQRMLKTSNFGLKTCIPPWRLENWAPFVANAFTASGPFAKICGHIFGQKLQVMNKCSRQNHRRCNTWIRSWIRVDFILYPGSKCHHWIKLPQVWEKILLKQKEY